MLAVVNTPTEQNATCITEVADPESKADEAVVAVQAFSLNRGELSLLANRPAGWRPGQDIAGIVLRAAADGSGPREGTRVVGLVDNAGWAERVAIPTSRIAVLSDAVSFAEAATLPIAGVTALRCVRLGGELLGQRVLITGASGAVGRFAVQLAARAGAEVTALVSHAERGNGLQELGAQAIVTALEGTLARFDVVLESIGGHVLEQAIQSITPNGTIVLYGNTSNQDAKLNLFEFIRHEGEGARLLTFFSFKPYTLHTIAGDLNVLLAMLAHGTLQAPVALEKSWRELSEGISALRERQVSGKVVFHID